jgi:hypothetical protein
MRPWGSSWGNGKRKNVLVSGELQNKGKRKKKIANPIFHECAKIASDPFWKDKFEKASYGKFPRGFSYSNNCLVYKKGNINRSLVVPEDPTVAYASIVFFFHEAANIYSDQDLEERQEEEHLAQIQEQLKEKTWAKTLKRQREVLIATYICELKERYVLSRTAILELEDLINIGILYNYFNKDTIILEDGIISEIKGLIYDESKGKFTTKEPLKPKIGKSSSKAKKIKPTPVPRHVPLEKDGDVAFMDEWNKFLDSIAKPNKTIARSRKPMRISRVNFKTEEKFHKNCDSNEDNSTTLSSDTFASHSERSYETVASPGSTLSGI